MSDSDSPKPSEAFEAAALKAGVQESALQHARENGLVPLTMTGSLEVKEGSLASLSPEEEETIVEKIRALNEAIPELYKADQDLKDLLTFDEYFDQDAVTRAEEAVETIKANAETLESKLHDVQELYKAVKEYTA